ncbi:MAG: hypothetical protein ACI4DV_03705 [Lachnospiraceae bacterium]
MGSIIVALPKVEDAKLSWQNICRIILKYFLFLLSHPQRNARPG